MLNILSKKKGLQSLQVQSGQKWSIICQLVNDQHQCVVCHNSDSFHWTDSCSALADCSLVIVKDQATADAVKAHHNIHHPP